jgi:hypothetical protein
MQRSGSAPSIAEMGSSQAAFFDEAGETAAGMDRAWSMSEREREREREREGVLITPQMGVLGVIITPHEGEGESSSVDVDASLNDNSNSSGNGGGSDDVGLGPALLEDNSNNSSSEAAAAMEEEQGGLASIFSSTAFSASFDTFQVHDFKAMIEQVAVGVASSNKQVSAYELRHVLLNGQSGFMLLMTYMYQISANTDLLEGNPIVASIKEAIPGPVKSMIEALTSAQVGSKSATTASSSAENDDNGDASDASASAGAGASAVEALASMQSVDDVMAALESWSDLADQLIVGGDNLLDSLENFKQMDEVEYVYIF